MKRNQGARNETGEPEQYRTERERRQAESLKARELDRQWVSEYEQEEEEQPKRRKFLGIF